MPQYRRSRLAGGPYWTAQDPQSTFTRDILEQKRNQIAYLHNTWYNENVHLSASPIKGVIS